MEQISLFSPSENLKKTFSYPAVQQGRASSLRTLQLPQGSISYELTRKKVKNINLRIKSDGSISVSASRSVPLSAIEDFLRSKEAWIRQALSKTQHKVATLEENQAYLCGQLVPLPAGCSRRQWLSSMAEDLLRKQYDEVWTLFQQDGFEKPQLRFRWMKSRWGSCIPSKGVITLNTALVSAPPESQQAVIAHELAHMKESNHQKGFYSYLYNRMPDYEQRHHLLRDMASILLDLSKS